MTNAERIRNLITEAGSQGITSKALAALAGVTPKNLNNNYLHVLRAGGLAFSASNANSGRSVHFAQKEWADAFAAQPPMTERECRRCCVVKLVTEFRKDPDMRSGRDSVCKECRKPEEKLRKPRPPRPPRPKAVKPPKPPKVKRGPSGTVILPGVDAPVKISKKATRAPQGEADYSRAKFTKIETPDYSARFRPEPGFVGPFSLAGIGRDVQTGKGWA